jgi:hypothetical protein
MSDEELLEHLQRIEQLYQARKQAIDVEAVDVTPSRLIEAPK